MSIHFRKHVSDAVHSAKPSTQEVISEYTRCHAYKILEAKEIHNPRETPRFGSNILLFLTAGSK